MKIDHQLVIDFSGLLCKRGLNKQSNQMVDTLFINGRFLTQDITGVQRYALEMLSVLDQLLDAQLERRVKFVCLTPDVDLKIKPIWKNINIQKTGPFSGNLWEQITLPFKSRGGFLFSPCNVGPFFKRKQIITIHDASVFAFKEAYTLPFRLKYQLNFLILGKIVPQIITVSEFSKAELVRYCHLDPKKIKVIYNGCDHQVIGNGKCVIDLTELPSPYILAVGSLSKHKNLGVVIQGVEMLDPGIHILVAGNTYSKVFSETPVKKNPRIHFLGYVHERDLIFLYQNALAFVFPSRYEGFGIPALEAMHNRCPVIASDQASLPEICGNAALYFNPNSAAEMAAQVNRLNSDLDLRAAMIQRGEVRAAQFTWSQCARETWEILNQVVRIQPR